MNANKVPEDSTLKRHYESQMKMNQTGGQSTTSTSRGASSKASSSSTGSGASSSGGGFLGWLKRLFGS